MSGNNSGDNKGGNTGGSGVGSGGGKTLRVEGTNVLRVPFGVRRARRTRPQRPDHWATLVLPFQGHNDPTPPPQAA
ncbi:MAG: hypothetical protein WD136_01085 [Cyanobium sp.]